MKKFGKVLAGALAAISLGFMSCSSDGGSSGPSIVGIQLSEDGKLSAEATTKADAQKLVVGKKYDVALQYKMSDGKLIDIDLDEEIEKDDTCFNIKLSNNTNDSDEDILKVVNDTSIRVAAKSDDTVVKVTITFKAYKATYYFTSKASDPAVVTLTGITVTPTSMDIKKGETGSFVVKASFSDGTNETVTAAAKAVSAKPAVATVSDGVVTAVGFGNAVIAISYTYGDDTEKASINVTVPDESINLESIAITTNNGTAVPQGGNIALAAKAVFSNGSEDAGINPEYEVTAGASYGYVDNGKLYNNNKETSEQTVTVKATYSYNGETKTDTKTFKVAAAPEIDDDEYGTGGITIQF